MKKTYAKVPDEISLEIRIQYQKFGVPLKDLSKQYPSYPKTTIYRHATKKICEVRYDKRKDNKGRPPFIYEWILI